MDADLERVLRGMGEAAAFARSYRFELTNDYLALIEQVEALPENLPGSVKSSRWRGRPIAGGTVVAPPD
jgi:hypothetical protein